MKGGVAAEKNYNYNEYTRDTGLVGKDNAHVVSAIAVYKLFFFFFF